MRPEDSSSSSSDSDEEENNGQAQGNNGVPAMSQGLMGMAGQNNMMAAQNHGESDITKVWQNIDKQ